jgi:hypothetical protein
VRDLCLPDGQEREASSAVLAEGRLSGVPARHPLRKRHERVATVLVERGPGAAEAGPIDEDSGPTGAPNRERQAPQAVTALLYLIVYAIFLISTSIHM